MINQIKRVANISKQSRFSGIVFNANVPLSITVLEKLYRNQYRLLVGKKELKAKSNRTLGINQQYWGVLRENKEDILNLSNLVQKPEIYNSSLAFLEIEFELLLQLLEEDPHPMQTFKKQIIKKMLDATTTKEAFLTLSYMLLAQNQEVFHLPLLFEGQKMLLQFENKDADITTFYLAFENLGPIRGEIHKNSQNKVISFEVIFEKTYQLLKKEVQQNNMPIAISLNDHIAPLFDSSDVLLDMKG